MPGALDPSSVTVRKTLRLQAAHTEGVSNGRYGRNH
jgi:hypothetical protein